MPLTPRLLNRATLDRQLLLERRELGVVDGVRTVAAIQAQSPPSPYLALWSRLAGFDPGELDRAFADGRVVKATLMRITLHAVAATDYPAFHHAMEHDLRRSRLGDRRFTAASLTIAEADALVPPLLAFADRPRTNAEFEAMLAERLDGLAAAGVWWAYRTFAPLVHAPTGGPWSFGERPAYVAAPLAPFDGDRTAALAVLVRRYLEAFGPATAADVGQFTLLPRPAVAAAIDALGDELRTLVGPGRAPLHDLAGASLPSEDVPAPARLLPMWDSILFAYRDRSRILPESYRRLVIRSNGDTLPVVLVDGQVAGVWRPAPNVDRAVEITAFHPLDRRTWREIEVEACALATFLAARRPDAYRRYARWWASLPAAAVRVLAG